jgi:hypothetical protein
VCSVLSNSINVIITFQFEQFFGYLSGCGWNRDQALVFVKDTLVDVSIEYNLSLEFSI